LPRLTAAEWKRVLLGVKNEFSGDRLTMIAGSIAFSSVISIFPVLIAIVSLYGLVADPADVARLVNELSATMPGSARELLYNQMREIVDSSDRQLGLGLLVSLVLALIAGSGGVHSLIDGINLAYDDEETRSFLQLRMLALVFTVGVVALTVSAVAAIAILPHVLEPLGLAPMSKMAITFARWPVLTLVVMVGLSILYRYAPNRARPVWHWISAGAVFATVVWLLASLGFGTYAANFGNYNKTYGTLAGLVVFMLWVYISTLAILTGAELDAELGRAVERRRDGASTVD
jgi:membrane protein